MSSNEPTAEPEAPKRSTSSVKQNRNDDDHHEEEMQAPTKAVPVPARSTSALGEYPHPDHPDKSKSWLQRHGIAPIFASGDGKRDPNDMPNRSPVGAVRQHSGITQQQIDTEKVKEAIHQKEEEAEEGTPWHQFSLDELQKELEMETAPEQGLSDSEVLARREKYGENKITPKAVMGLFERFLRSLLGGFQLMMFVGSILSFIVFGIDSSDIQTLTLGIMLFSVTIITSMFQSYQEGKADNVMEALRAQLAEKVNCLRDGEWKSIDAVELVPGDYVEVQSGEKVPADLRITWGSDLKVNNASLTGENVDIKLGADANHTKIFEAKNIARNGCNFTCGKGRGIVFATGDNTFFGQIAFATTQTERPDSLMKREIHRLIMFMGIIAAIIGAVFLGLSLGFGYSWDAAIVFTIGIIVANVPEGLLPQLTVALALTAKKLLHKQVLVTNLEIIETLGAVTVICSDKTGTLTCNRMTVSHAVYGSEVHITKHTPNMEGDTWTECDAENASFKQLLRCANLCSDAVFTDTTNENVLKWVAKGDASESAIVKFVQPYQGLHEYRDANPRKVGIPFNSSNKYMVSINAIGGAGSAEHLLTMKGAPERIFDRCAFCITPEGNKVAFDQEQRQVFENLNMTLGKRGERVIAFAELELPANEYGAEYEFDAEAEIPNFPMNGLTLLGLISMIDPPRDTVPSAIASCHSAGVKVFMVTGDHPITALAISKSLGLVTQPTAEELKEEGKEVPEDYHGAIAIHGTELAKFTQEQWDHVLKHDEIVFARTQPQQKQDIVRQLTALGHVVAMTGDGVNDAPALKAAHVGVAMGESGAQVAKEAAQIVLLKDDFSNIVDGVREGRTIFENMKKAISYVLVSNIPQLVPFLIYIAGKLPLAMETLVILCIDLGTDILPAIALAYEEPEDSIMDRKPRSPDEHLVSTNSIVVVYGTVGMFQAIAMLFAFGYVFTDAGWPIDTWYGAGPEYRAKSDDISADQKAWFQTWCQENTKFTGNAANFDECRGYRIDVLERAQGAAFLSIVWGQLANLVARKTAEASALTWYRLTHNTFALVSIVVEIALVMLLVYTPGLNSAFGMDRPSSKHASVSLWIIPWIIIWEETRKWIIRTWPDGCVARFTRF